MPSTAKADIDLREVRIGPFDSKLNRTAFCCGNGTIDNFFKFSSKDQHKMRRVRVYVAAYSGHAIGFYCLVAASHDPEKVCPEASAKFGRAKLTPCVYLGMIGVNEAHQRGGVGRLLMAHAMEKTLEVADLVGIYALTLHAVDEQKAQTYKKWGFEEFVAGELAMYISLATIREALGR